jgi:hypothetical protein
MVRKISICLVCFSVVIGCKKQMDDIQKSTELGKDEKPKIIPGGGGNLTVGGGGGAVQAVRKAAARIVNTIELDQLSKSIQTAMTLDPDNKVPDAKTIMEEIRQNGKLVGLIQAEVIILTNTKQADGIWAYTQWPQQENQHRAITRQGVEIIAADQLQQRLQAQGSTVKLSQ